MADGAIESLIFSQMGPTVVAISQEEKFSGLPARVAGMAGNGSDLGADEQLPSAMELLPEEHASFSSSDAWSCQGTCTLGHLHRGRL